MPFVRSFLSVLLLISAGAHVVYGAAPTNDLCSGAQVIPASGPFPFYSGITADVSGATTNGDPAVPSCVASGATRSIWYRFTPSASGFYTLSVSDDTATTVPDTVMALYGSGGSCAGPFTQIACNDDAGSLRSAISRSLTAASNYFIVVWVSALSAPLTNGHSAVQLRVSKPVTPANDTCAGAELIPSSGPFPYLTSVADDTLATSSGDPPAPLCQATFSRSLWYKFTPTTTTTYTLSTCDDTATTAYDTLMAIYTSSGSCGGPFNMVACNDNSCSFRAAITTTLTSSVPYYIVVSESGADPYTPGETSVQMRISGVFAPVVTTLPATSIASTGAVLNATVNASSAATTAWFDWGTTTNYANSTPPQSTGNSSTNVAISASVGGLTGGVTYFFRVRATNVIGSSVGSNLSFTWNSSRPSFSSQTRPTNGVISLRINGVAQQKYLIYASTNLSNWTLLGTATDNGGGAFSFLDPNVVSFKNRFYRVLAP